VIRELAATGVARVQFIGGEPTMNPDLPHLITEAVSHGLEVSVYTNLVFVNDAVWSAMRKASAVVYTSFYSSNALEHDAVTTRPGSHDRTLENIRQAVDTGLEVNVGVVKTALNPDVSDLVDLLTSVGVRSVNVDNQRPYGRGDIKGPSIESFEEQAKGLCGHCTAGVMAIDPNGNVHPCIMSRFVDVGNIGEKSVPEIATTSLADARRALADAFAADGQPGSLGGSIHANCSPRCDPISCPPTCPPVYQGCPPQAQYCPPNAPPAPPPTYCPPNGGGPPVRPPGGSGSSFS